ncbi:MAG: hypothetical protein M1828_004938 [Chrysothrix sp. TS-e1954]|nr:MAG: hypothetical protein M1828_004938 [Chrysothrix sp. TS-e1954]
MSKITFAMRVCKRLGVQTIIVTNAAGGLAPTYKVGDIIMLRDHLNLPGLVGSHPLVGPNVEEFGVRFPPLSDAYSLALRRRAHRAWTDLGLASVKGPLKEGVYAFVAGPSYETRAESRMLRLLGADLVGMSTVPEIVTARHAGMCVLAFSLVTNMVVMDEGLRGDDKIVQNMTEAQLQEHLGKGMANHAEVLEAGEKAASTMQVRQGA